MTPAPRSARLAYVPELDALRALSVVAVLVHHVPACRAFAQGAFLGVDVFFVLSGALITRILLRELDDTGTVSLKRFYVRRLRRLFPGLFAMVVATSVAAWFVLPRSAYGAYLWDAARCAAYLGAFMVPHRAVLLVGHTWSLSIEEAFYLIWPGVLVLLGPSRRRAACLLLILALVASPAWRAHLWFDEMASWSRIYFALDTRIDTLAWGCLVGFASHAGWLGRARRLLAVLAPLCGVALLLLAHFASRSETWFSIAGYTLASMLAGIVVARLLAGPSRVMRAPPLVWLGKRSYSLYLWHLPIFHVGSMLGVPFRVLVPLSVVVAALSYRFVEMPLRAPRGADVTRSS